MNREPPLRHTTEFRIVPDAFRSEMDRRTKQATLIGDRKRRNEYLRANGFQPLQPVTVSTPAAPSSPPEACVDCGGAVEASQGMCRYCVMKRVGGNR